MIRAAVLAFAALLATSGCGALAGRPMETWAHVNREEVARLE